MRPLRVCGWVLASVLLTAQSGFGIRGGTRDDGDRAVGFVMSETTGAAANSGPPFPDGCSGTLIAPQVVLTAAHCVACEYNARTADDPRRRDDCSNRCVRFFAIGRGNSISQDAPSMDAVRGMTQYQADRAVHFPDWSHGAAGDVALIHLRRPVTGVTPLRVGRGPARGAHCQMVGFGCTRGDADPDPRLNRCGPSGQKRRGAVVVTGLADGERSISSDGTRISHHSGDSGGPLICSRGMVSGLVSRPARADVNWFASMAPGTQPTASGNTVPRWIEASMRLWAGNHDVPGDRPACGPAPHRSTSRPGGTRGGRAGSTSSKSSGGTHSGSKSASPSGSSSGGKSAPSGESGK